MSVMQLIRVGYHPVSARVVGARGQLLPIAIVLTLLIGLLIKLATSWPLDRPTPAPEDSARPEVTGPFV
jgi:hypothetical protein